MKPQAVKGTRDILPDEQAAWQAIITAAETTFGRAGVAKLTPPIFENSEIFTKSVGDSSDLVVQHEMYSFSDRGGRSLTLRPEFTAGVLRAFIEHGFHTKASPVKLWSHGPAFRAENVQRGRYRQFHQINCELLGLDNPLLDAEAIALLITFLQTCGLSDLTVRLGTVGDPGDRAAYNHYLRERLEPRREQLSPTSRERLERNPLRILDSKDPHDQELLKELKRPLDFLNAAAARHFEAVQRYLRDWDIPYLVDPSLVRGLDYYRRTAFEVHHRGIGAQSALGGGGRYDGLVASLGGPPTPGIGWAAGIERLLDATRQEGSLEVPSPGPQLYLVPLDEQAVAEVARLAHRLRRRYHVEYAYQPRKVGRGISDADRRRARYAGLRGSRERARNSYQLKRLASGEQREVAELELGDFLADA